jgi:hypothetical protein
MAEFCLVVLGIEHSAPHMLGKHSNFELHPQHGSEFKKRHDTLSPSL